MQKYVFGWGFRHADKEYLHNGARNNERQVEDKLEGKEGKRRPNCVCVPPLAIIADQFLRQ